FLPRDLFRSVQSTGQALTHKQISGLQDPNNLMPAYWEVTIGPVLTGKQITGFILSTVEVTEREHLLRQREDFIAALSHNLKTPLVGADRTLEQLLNGAIGQLSAEQAQVLESLKRSNFQLLGMVKDLIEVYRYETNSADLKLEPQDLGDLSRQCMNELQQSARARLVGLRCNIEGVARIKADGQALKRLMLNLLEHSLSQTPSGGLIEISAHCDAQSAVLTVKDGAACSHDDNPEKLFMSFGHGEYGKSYSASSGLGLYLCRQIATAHGGTISLSCEPGVGTTYSVTLPGKR
ncbi:MAG: sensor histidine kinase, partial [Terriglobales bacterium]